MFSSSFDENYATYQTYDGRNRANSYEYNTHVPSAVPVIPYALVSPYGQYPSHGQFSNIMVYEGEAPRLMTSQHQRHQQTPQAHKGRVHFAEHDTIQYPNLGQFNEAPRLMNKQHRQQQHAPQAHKGRVHFAEPETITTDHAPQARKGRVHFEADTVTEAVDQKNGRVKVQQDNIDADADGFIRLKHKNFELSRWETFKGY